MDSRDSRRTAAIGYDVGRRGVQPDDWTPAFASHALDVQGRRLLSPMALRVLCVLTGRWVAAFEHGCQPLRGRHGDGCVHSMNRLDLTMSWLARDVTGYSGGSQTKLISAALDELAHATSEYRVVTLRGVLREVSHILSVRAWEPHEGHGPPRHGYVAGTRSI